MDFHTKVTFCGLSDFVVLFYHDHLQALTSPCPFVAALAPEASEPGNGGPSPVPEGPSRQNPWGERGVADGAARAKVQGPTERLRGCARSGSVMAAELESLEQCLERHIPPGELAEVKRILYGGEPRCATRTGSPLALRVSVRSSSCRPPRGCPAPVWGEDGSVRAGVRGTGLGWGEKGKVGFVGM